MNSNQSRVHRLAIFLVIILFAVASARASVRVAVIGQSDDASACVSLAYPKLSSLSGVEMVERGEVMKAIQEQAISLAQAVDVKQALAVGKIARADLLAVVEPGNPSESASPMGFVAFDAFTGIRLCDFSLPAKSGEEIANAIADDVNAAVLKLNSSDKARRVICMLSARNADLPVSDNGYCDAVAALLQRRLIDSPAVVILERERLGLINQEQAVAGSNDAGKTLAPSVVTIQLDVSRGEDSSSTAVSASAALCDIHQHPLGVARARGDIGDPEGLASHLAAQVLKSLALSGSSDPSAVDVQLESARFQRESLFRITHKDWKEAADAAGAAYALIPSSPRVHTLLARTLIMSGIAQFEPQIEENGVFFAMGEPVPDLEAKLQLLQRATNELLAAGKLPGGREKLEPDVIMLHQFIVEMLGDDQGAIRRIDKEGQFSSPRLKLNENEQKELTSVIRDYQTYTTEIDEPGAKAVVHNEKTFEDYTAILLRLVGDECHLFALTTNEYTAEIARRFPDWSSFAAKYATKYVVIYGPAEELTEAAAWSWCCTNHDWMSRWRPACFDEKLNAVDARNWQTAIVAMKDAGVPWRFYINLQPWVTELTKPAVAVAPLVIAAPAQVPEPVVPAPVKPLAAVKLLYSKEVTLLNVQAAGSDLRLINKPIWLGDDLYCVALAKAESGASEMRLLKMPADGHDRPKVLSKVAVDIETSDKIGTDPLMFFQSSCYLGATHCVISPIGSDEIFVLPFENAAGRKISAGRDLPGPNLQGAADLGNTLYLALQSEDSGSYLVSYDLKTGHTRTLVSSRRQEKQSPFDDMAPMAVPFLVPDPARDRIIFFAYHSQWNSPAKGLWEYNQSTGKFRKLRDTTYDRKENEGGYEISGSHVVDDKFILDTGVEKLVYDLTIDLATDKIPPGLSRFHGSFYEPEIFKSWWHRYGDPGGSGVGFGDNTMERRIGDVHAFSELWQGSFPLFAEDIPDGRLLVADATGIWLVTPR